MPPVRIVPPVEPEQCYNAICVVYITVIQIPLTSSQRSSMPVGYSHDMCRLCAMNQAEERAQRRTPSLFGRALWRHNLKQEEHIQTRSGLTSTIRIPPRICTLCHTDYLLPLAGVQSDRHGCETFFRFLARSTRVTRPCQKSEKCSHLHEN
jgi:hypothetical protein